MYSLKKLEDIASDQINGKVLTVEDLTKKLTTWFCFTLNTTPNDSRLLDMTLEELIVFYLSHKIKENPEYVAQSDIDEYENWLREEMGENYTSEDDMIKEHEKLEKKEQEEYDKIKDKYPEKVTTDFSQFRKD